MNNAICVHPQHFRARREVRCKNAKSYSYLCQIYSFGIADNRNYDINIESIVFGLKEMNCDTPDAI